MRSLSRRTEVNSLCVLPLLGHIAYAVACNNATVDSRLRPQFRAARGVSVTDWLNDCYRRRRPTCLLADWRCCATCFSPYPSQAVEEHDTWQHPCADTQTVIVNWQKIKNLWNNNVSCQCATALSAFAAERRAAIDRYIPPICGGRMTGQTERRPTDTYRRPLSVV